MSENRPPEANDFIPPGKLVCVVAAVKLLKAVPKTNCS